MKTPHLFNRARDGAALEILDDPNQTLPASLNPDWLALADTARRLGKSQSTIERLVGSRALRSKLAPRPGRKPERLYNAEDVKRLAEEGGAGNSRTFINPSKKLAADGAPGAALTQLVLAHVLDSQRPHAKLWLTFEEAEEYSGLAESYLQRAVREGKLRAIKGGPHGVWTIQRVSLEEFAG